MMAICGRLNVKVVLVVVLCSFIPLLSSTVVNARTWKKIIKVDQSGNGSYVKIQDAIDSVPSNNVEPVFIRVEPGVYKEKIVVPSDKPFITLSGRNADKTIITWGDSGDIFECPTVSVFASDFVGRYLTIQNTYGEGAKAVALRVSADKASFYACRILSYQDTLLDDTGRHYYSNCYIEGATDFIFGNAASLFKNCHLHSISEGEGAITAHHRDSPKENTGFYFVKCKVTGIKTCILGRPWGAYSRVIFAQTYMSGVVLPQGWDDWGQPSTHSTAYYGEYKCYGPGAQRTGRVKWSRSLTTDEVSHFMSIAAIDGRSWIQASHL